MPQYFPSIPQHLAEWALSQPLFFTASAPLCGSHINISPKGLPSSTLSILSSNTVAYVDATGSGIETVSHVYENGRVTVMFCSFDKSPRILRFFCTGEVVEWDQPAFEPLLDVMAGARGGDAKERAMVRERYRVESARAVVLLSVWKVRTSCGFGVPLFDLSSERANPPLGGTQGMPAIGDGTTASDAKESHSTRHNQDADESSPRPTTVSSQVWDDRPTLFNWGSKQVRANKMRGYQMKNNAYSLDGLPGLRTARRDHGEWCVGGWFPRTRPQGPRHAATAMWAHTSRQAPDLVWAHGIDLGEISAWTRRLQAQWDGIAVGGLLMLALLALLKAVSFI